MSLQPTKEGAALWADLMREYSKDIHFARLQSFSKQIRFEERTPLAKSLEEYYSRANNDMSHTIDAILFTLKNLHMKPTVKEAMDVLAEALREDKSPGSYYHTWQANIAVAIMDELKSEFPHFSTDLIHRLSNKSAQRFLDNLLYRPAVAKDTFSSRSCKVDDSPFRTAIERAGKIAANEEHKKLSEIITAGETILKYAIPSTSPDDYTGLERLLVNLYRHHAKR